MADRQLRLFSGNVAKRAGATLDAQVAAIRALRPDIVALQEVTPAAAAIFRAQLAEHAEDTAVVAERYQARACTLVASRWPLRRLPAPVVPSPERILSVVASTPWGPVELHNAHILDGSGNGWDKVLMLEGLYTWLTAGDGHGHRRILCGDFNCPDRELPDGRIVTSDQTVDDAGIIRPFGVWADQFGRQDTGVRWDAAERQILEGLAGPPHDLGDAYRRLRLVPGQPFAPEASWRHKRLDHVFASSSLNPVECRYLHEWHEQGLSDHAAMLTTFAPTLVSGVE